MDQPETEPSSSVLILCLNEGMVPKEKFFLIKHKHFIHFNEEFTTVSVHVSRLLKIVV